MAKAREVKTRLAPRQQVSPTRKLQVSKLSHKQRALTTLTTTVPQRAVNDRMPKSDVRKTMARQGPHAELPSPGQVSLRTNHKLRKRAIQ